MACVGTQKHAWGVGRVLFFHTSNVILIGAGGPPLVVIHEGKINFSLWKHSTLVWGLGGFGSQWGGNFVHCLDN